MGKGDDIGKCLATLRVLDAVLDGLTIEEQWSCIKRGWFRMAKESHPDKGGDPADFREAQVRQPSAPTAIRVSHLGCVGPAAGLSLGSSCSSRGRADTPHPRSGCSRLGCPVALVGCPGHQVTRATHGAQWFGQAHHPAANVAHTIT